MKRQLKVGVKVMVVSLPSGRDLPEELIGKVATIDRATIKGDANYYDLNVKVGRMSRFVLIHENCLKAHKEKPTPGVLPSANARRAYFERLDSIADELKAWPLKDVSPKDPSFHGLWIRRLRLHRQRVLLYRENE